MLEADLAGPSTTHGIENENENVTPERSFGVTHKRP